MKLNFYKKTICLIVLLLSILPCIVIADEIGPDFLMTGICDFPLRISIFSPEYKHIAQFGEERKDFLNRILQHIAVSVNLDGPVSETVMMIDEEPFAAMTESITDSGLRLTRFSFEPNTVYEQPVPVDQQNSQEFSGFVETHFFSLNRLLDDLYPMFDRSAESFQSLSRQTPVNLTFKGYGKGVKKVMILFSDAYVSEHFPSVLSELIPTDESRLFVDKLLFRGQQKMTLLFDQNNVLLRMNYDGSVGLSEESMRKVSLSWKSVRSADIKKDSLTLKTPASNGDRYNVIYDRNIDLSDPSRHNISWDLQIDLKDNQLKQKAAYKGDLVFSDQKLIGQIQLAKKQDKEEKTISITPSLQKENDAQYNGTIEIADISGKIVISSMKASVSISSGDSLSIAEESDTHTTVKVPGTPETSAWGPVQDKLNSIMIHRLLSLPEEDLVFFSMDIPEDVWQSINQLSIQEILP